MTEHKDKCARTEKTLDGQFKNQHLENYKRVLRQLLWNTEDLKYEIDNTDECKPFAIHWVYNDGKSNRKVWVTTCKEYMESEVSYNKVKLYGLKTYCGYKLYELTVEEHPKGGYTITFPNRDCTLP